MNRIHSPMIAHESFITTDSTINASRSPQKASQQPLLSISNNLRSCCSSRLLFSTPSSADATIKSSIGKRPYAFIRSAVPGIWLAIIPIRYFSCSPARHFAVCGYTVSSSLCQGVTGKPSAFSGCAFFCFANCTACKYAWSYVIFVPFMASSILCSLARLSSTKVEPTSKNNHSIRLNIPILSFLSFKPQFIFRKVHLQSTF